MRLNALCLWPQVSLPLLLSLVLASCAGVRAGETADRQSQPDAAVLPTLLALDKLRPPGPRSVSDITHDLLASAPLSQSNAVTYDQVSGTLSLTPAAGESAWAIFGISGLPLDGSKFPLRINASADAAYFLLVSDYAAGRWRLLTYSPQGIYPFIDGQSLVSPAGSFFVAVLAWQTQPLLSSLSVTTNEDEVIPGTPHELWYYEQTNLQVGENLVTAVEHLNTAAAAGYSTVVYADTKLEFIDQASEVYLNNLATYKAAADAVGISIVPNMVSPGYANGLLIHDPNLIEGQPVIDAPFLVQNGFAGNFAGVIQNPATTVANGDFEQHSGDSFDGWEQIDGAGLSTFADPGGHDASATCIRFEDFEAGSPGIGNARIRQQLTVDPWQVYSVNFWLKTENVVPVGQLWARVFDQAVSEQLTFLTFPIASSQDWVQYHLIFNSQGNTQVQLYLGIWGGESGRFWLDDVTIEHSGLMNLIRRPGAPFKVTNEDGSIVYSEGVGLDFDPVIDTEMGNSGGNPGNYDLYHASPLIQKIGGSIQIGDILKVSYYHAAFTDDLKPACALEEQDVYDIIDEVLNVIHTQLDPEMIFIGVDEHRVAGWSEPGFSANKTSGESLAGFTAEVDSIAAAIDPAWKIVTWSDMYDPYHNGVENYYLCRGGMDMAPAGLPESWDVANWHFFDDASTPEQNERSLALQHFASRGNRQILAGYYDNPGGYVASLYTWLDEAKGLPGTFALMYTTWNKDFSKLAEFAQTVRDWEEANP